MQHQRTAPCITPRTFVLNPETRLLTELGQPSILQYPLEGFRSTLPIVVLDAGHGVRAPGYWRSGAERGDVREAEVARNIAMRTAAALNARGYEVIVTRDSDRIYNLPDAFAFRDAAARVATAAYVSVHVNAQEGGSTLHGMELYSDARANITSHHLRDTIQRGFAPWRAVSDRAQWRMTNPAYIGSIPSVLVETGYLTNDGDFANLRNNAWRNQLAQRLAGGIDQFHRSRHGARNLEAECRDQMRAAMRGLMGLPFDETPNEGGFTLSPLLPNMRSQVQRPRQ